MLRRRTYGKQQIEDILTFDAHIANQLGLINFSPYIFYQRYLGATGQFSLYTISLRKKLVFTKYCAKSISNTYDLFEIKVDKKYKLP